MMEQSRMPAEWMERHREGFTAGVRACMAVIEAERAAIKAKAGKADEGNGCGADEPLELYADAVLGIIAVRLMIIQRSGAKDPRC